MEKKFEKLLGENRIINAVKNLKDLDRVLQESSKIIFLLCGDICNLEETTRKIKSAGKIAFVHMDMVAGISGKDSVAVDYIKENSFAEGIITTKINIAKYAKSIGMMVIQRCFLIDSLSFENTKKILHECEFDAVEILPGVMPKIIKKLSEEINTPLIAGGLISDIEDIEIALNSGAIAVSTTKLDIGKNSKR
ncbi:MAG: glycerol-3-phosphate responsive antiterminator [Fusobacteriaceae bacterium]